MQKIESNDVARAIDNGKKLKYTPNGKLYFILYPAKFKFPGELWLDVIMYESSDGVFSRVLSDLDKFEFVD